MIWKDASDVDVAILTALDVEETAVLEAIGISSAFRWQRSSLHRAGVKGQQVLVFPIGGIGNVSAAQAAEHVIATWKPTSLLLVGIAGGIPDAPTDTRLGDILVADQVVGYQLAKVTSAGAAPHYQVYQPDANLLARARRVRPPDWADGIAIPRPGDPRNRIRPIVHIGPVLSGDKVVADAEALAALGRAWPTAIGIEMEGQGVAHAAHQHGVSFLVIKAVSDFADDRKNDDWHRYAATAAARFAVAVLASAGQEVGPRETGPVAHDEDDGHPAIVSTVDVACGAGDMSGESHDRAATTAGTGPDSTGPTVLPTASGPPGPDAASAPIDRIIRKDQLTRRDRLKLVFTLLAAFMAGIPLSGHMPVYWMLGLEATAFMLGLALLFTPWDAMRVAVKRKRYLLLVAAGIMIGLLGGVPVGRFFLSPGPPAHVVGCSPRVVIGQPSGARPVPPTVTAEGTATCIPTNQTLWLVVRVGQGYYPQTKIDLRPSGVTRWTQSVAFGAPGGQWSTLYAVGANAAASKRFDTYLQHASAHPVALTEADATYPRVVPYASVSIVSAPSPPPPLAVTITTPMNTVSCSPSAPQCQFQVAGTSADVASNLSLQILVMVFPVHPAGGGWYVQLQPASVQSNGNWSQTPSYIGSVAGPTHNGDTFQIEAVVVRADAAYNGIRLRILSARGQPIFDPRQIQGLVAQSSIIQLRVKG